MRVLADENVYVAVVAALRDAGHEVVHVLRSSPGLRDPEVLAQAGGRVLITEDRDFGALIYAQGLTPLPVSVLYLRVGQARPRDVAARVVEVRSQPPTSIAGVFMTVTMQSIRRRPLPVR